jgi:signal transduction histidine kinase
MQRYLDEQTRSWKAHLAETERSTAMVTTMLLLVIYASWAGVDFLLERERLAQLLPERFSVVGLAAILTVVLWRVKSVTVDRIAMALEVLVAGAMVAHFTVIVSHTVFYTVAFSLVFWGFGLMLRWHWSLTAACFAALHLIHLAIWLMYGGVDPATFVSFYLFLVTTSMTSVVGGVVRMRLQRIAFVSAFDLERKHEEIGALIGNTSSAIWSVDRLSRPIAGNQVFTARFQGDAGGTRWQAHYLRAFHGEQFSVELTEELAGAAVPLEVSFNPIRHGNEVTGVAVFAQDISVRKTQEQRIARAHRELLTASRLAGMSEVASDVLHNVGNALNSASVSAQLAVERLQQLRIDRVERSAALLQAATKENGPAGKVEQIGDYLKQLGVSLSVGRASTVTELQACLESLDKVAKTVAAQNAHARVVQVDEEVGVFELLATAVELCQPQLGEVRVEVAPADELSVRVDRFKIVQILSNMILHAGLAAEAAHRLDGVVRVSVDGGASRLAIEVADNGKLEDRADSEVVFRQAFGTGPDLHWSHLAARQIGGELKCRVDEQAVLRLELPLRENRAAVEVAAAIPA